jgi:hypothetical protein
MSRMMPWLALIFALGLTPGGAAQTPTPQPSALDGSSIKILACSVDYNSISGVVDQLHVDFINKNSQAVTHIRFGVHMVLSRTIPVMDIGTFRPNLKIHHDLMMPLTRVFTFSQQSLDCTIDAFTLADGTTWIDPALPVPLPQPPR